MAWTYSGNPAASARDEIRFLSGDTDSAQRWTLQDGEVDYAVAKYPDNRYLAAAVCAEAIIAKLKSTVADKSVGDLKITYNTNMLAEFAKTAYRLRQRAAIAACPPTFGGQSIAGKAAIDDDPDKVQMAHKVDEFNKVGNVADPSSNRSV